MKRKFFSTLLMGALVCASLSTVTSCKDYDDDINNLQEQIDKAALSSTVESLQSQLSSVSSTASSALSTAESALTKANAAATADALAAVKTTADKAATDVATAIANAAAAQATADDAAKAAKAAQETADKAIKDAAETYATKAELATKADQTALEAALTRIGTLESTYATAESVKSQLDELKKLIAEQGTETVAGLKAQIEAYKASINELYSAVTSVELVGSYCYATGQGYKLTNTNEPIAVALTHGLIAADSKFGDETDKNSDPLISYVKGADVKDPKALIVRVNPVNADLTKGTKIILVNSKGEGLDDIVTVGTPERYNQLLTRGTTINSGLWTLPLTVADGVTEKAFNAAVKDKDGNAILYAVAVNNTTADSVAEADRYVVSSYDVTTTYTKYAPASSFSFEVGGKAIAEIHNRWTTGSEIKTENSESTIDNPELKWAENTKDHPTPAVAPVSSPAKNVNYESDDTDQRFSKQCLQVEVGKPFSLKKFVGGSDEALDYYYVVLDKTNAIESAPSEINAWNSYSYTGLYKTTPADSTLDITINSASAEGDIIGFRVYAVNRDGTLADPDGRAFYVVVGEQASSALTGNIYANVKENAATDTVAFSYLYNASYEYVGWTVTNADDEKVFGANKGDDNVPTFTAHYLDKDGKSVTVTDAASAAKVASVYFTCSDVSKIIDGATVKLSLKVYKNKGQSNETLVKEYTGSFTKKLPTEFTASIAFRPEQEVTTGSGQFILYMNPGTAGNVSGWVYSATPKTQGQSDLDNVFYNLDTNVHFTFADAAYKQDGKTLTTNTCADGHILTEGVKFIDSKTWHAVTAYQVYPNVSYAKNSQGNLEVSDVKVASSKSLSAQFACWESANKYAWHTADAVYNADGTVKTEAVDKTPSLQWTAAGTSVTTYGQDLDVKNSYNNDFFGGTLQSLVNTKKYLAIKANSAHLKVDGQVDPYFKVVVRSSYLYGGETIHTSQMTFTQTGTQVENAPTEDHVETLEFTVVDAFGHESVVSVPVNVLAPTKAAKKN